MDHSHILQLVIAKQLEWVLFFAIGIVFTPLVVITGTNLALEIHKWRIRSKARKFLRTARPEKVDAKHS